MFSTGRVCIKIAGRDAGKKCVVLKHVEGKLYLVDGETRRRKCNTLHLEPTDEKVDVSEDATHEEVMKALGLAHIAKKSKSKTEKPKKVRAEKKKAPKVTERKAKKKAKSDAKKESKKASKKQAPAENVEEKKE